MTTPEDIIRAKGRDAVRVYRLERELGTRLLRSLTRVMDQLGQEYGERFVYELVQNAHDAQTRGAQGVVRVVLSRHGSLGTVYVANTGEPFREANFHALCDVAQSDKSPGAGIGNKGVGFRSVLQVCRAPEIYSASQGTPGFGGYCFRFATDADYCQLSEGDSEFCDLLRRDVSPYLLPVPADEPDELINEFAGMATVIKLPLDNEHARAIARKRIGEISAATAPTLLFLERIGRLVIDMEQEDGSRERTELSRKVEWHAPEHDGVTLERVVLLRTTDGESAALGSYLLVSMTVDPEHLRTAIDESIAAGKLDARFSEWNEPAVVSIAVRLDAEEPTPVMYAFLPMEAASPLPAHLNAPFVPKVARTTLDETVPLNALLLDVAAQASVRAALRLRDDPGQLPSAERDRAIVDLICWRTEYQPRLVAAFEALGKDFAKEPLVARESPLGGWAPLGSVHIWRESLRVLNAQRLAACGVPLVTSALRSKQCERLIAAAAAVGCNLDATKERIARWAELVAQDMAQSTSALQSWVQLYDDLYEQFRYLGRDTLRGKKLLLDDRGTLHTSGAGVLAVFFAPAEGALSDIRIPETLATSVTFLHRGLELRPAVREFLLKAELALRYDTRELISHIAAVAQATNDTRVLADALGTAFALYVAAGAKPAMLEGVKLYVPARDAWVAAHEAHFSAEWVGTRGPLLCRLIAAARGVSRDLDALQARLLRPPSDEPFATDRVPEWVGFLRQLGVRDGLWPQAMSTLGTLQGYELRPAMLGSKLGLSGDELQRWKAANGAEARHPYTGYKASGAFFRLPGQSDQDQFGASAKKLYAELVAYGLGVWGEEHLRVTADIVAGRRKDPLSWLTPAAVFVRESPWMPVGREFLRPRDAWHFRRNARDEHPHFFPLLRAEISDLIDANPTGLERLRTIGELKVFNDPRDASWLLERLPQLLAAGKVSDAHTRKFGQAYRRAWAAVADGARAVAPAAVVVSRGAHLAVTPAVAEGETVYVNDTGDQLAILLLGELQKPVLEVRESKAAKAALMLLREQMGERIRGISAANIIVMLDGTPVAQTQASQPLVSHEYRWLEDLVGLVVDLHARTEQTDRDLQRRLGSVHIRWAKTIAVSIDGDTIDLASANRRVLLLPQTGRSVIAVASEVGSMDWSTLELLAPILCRAIGQTGVEHALLAAIMRLARIMPELPATPADAELALALSCPIEDVRRLRVELRTSVGVVVERLRPLLYYFAPDELATLEPELAGAATKAAIAALLAEVAERLPVAVDELLRFCEASDLADLRDKLGLDFARFNAVLAQLGPPYRPYRHEQEHAEAFAAFKQASRAHILRLLRAHFVPDFEAGTSLAAYIALRGLEGLTADPAWLDVCGRPSDAMMQARVDAWLESVGANDTAEITLEEVDTLRLANRRATAEFARRAASIVSSWSRKNSAPLPPLWSTPNPGAALADAMHESGMFDFCVLTSDQIFNWLQANESWPESMPATTELAVLGLTADDLRDKTEADIAREAQERQRRTIEFQGARYGADQVGALLGAVETSLSGDFLATKKSITDPSAAPRRRPTTSGGGERKPTTPPTDEQRALIGLVGEKAALEWLRRQYPGTDETCWKSTNRDRALGGHEGDDSLGYDFEIFDKGRRLYFEVKATAGEHTVIELGESEVRFAYQQARNERYRILFIPHVLDAPRRTLHVLPNPLSERGRACYEAHGTGIRYHFRLNS